MKQGTYSLAERLSLLDAPHMVPIEAWRRGLVDAGYRMPHADPMDGGVDARLLLLLETPGPGGDGARFVSQDNPTGTGRNLRRFLAEAGIDRRELLIWNVVPWIVHPIGARNRAVRRGELREGLAALPSFLALLPRLAVVILAGRSAAAAELMVRGMHPQLPILTMPHPSPTYVCTDPAIADRIVATLRAVREVLG